MRAETKALEEKVSRLKSSAAHAHLEQALAAFLGTTSRLEQMAGPIDSLAAREALLTKTDLATTYAAWRQGAKATRQARLELNRWFEADAKKTAVWNANIPTFKLPEQQAQASAFTAETNRLNTERRGKQAEREQLDSRIKPLLEAWERAGAAVAAAKAEKDKAMKPLFAEGTAWQAQLVWMKAAVDVAASGGNPALALTPFPSGGAAPSSAGLAARDTVSPGTNAKADAQLKSFEQHSGAAAAEGNKEGAGKGVDTSGRENGSLVSAHAAAGRPAPAFVGHLPERAKADTQIQQSVAYYQKLDSLKADTAQKIEAVKLEQASGKGDAAVLAARLGTLGNDLKRQQSDQAQTKERLKKRVKDLGFEWDEAPPPVAAVKATE